MDYLELLDLLGDEREEPEPEDDFDAELLADYMARTAEWRTASLSQA